MGDRLEITHLEGGFANAPPRVGKPLFAKDLAFLGSRTVLDAVEGGANSCIDYIFEFLQRHGLFPVSTIEVLDRLVLESRICKLLISGDFGRVQCDSL